MSESRLKRILTPTVLIAALGYFVDLFDITLFGVVRSTSLKALGVVSVEDLINVGVKLYNCQMGGMLIGGIFWGIIGDKKGRHIVLYSSIFMYSAANILNAFVMFFLLVLVKIQLIYVAENVGIKCVIKCSN